MGWLNEGSVGISLVAAGSAERCCELETHRDICTCGRRALEGQRHIRFVVCRPASRAKDAAMVLRHQAASNTGSQ